METSQMARIDLNPSTLQDFEARIRAIHSTEQRQWGTMTVAQMFAHLRITFEISLEERETKDESRAWLLPIVWVLMFQIWTDWPKGKIPASQQFLDDDANDVEAERTQLIESLHRFTQRAENDPERIVLEPMLGKISLRKWQRVHGVHTDYHLRQFDS
jgi:hypothetical protein